MRKDLRKIHPRKSLANKYQRIFYMNGNPAPENLVCISRAYYDQILDSWKLYIGKKFNGLSTIQFLDFCIGQILNHIL